MLIGVHLNKTRIATRHGCEFNYLNCVLSKTTYLRGLIEINSFKLDKSLLVIGGIFGLIIFPRWSDGETIENIQMKTTVYINVEKSLDNLFI